jgi:hypothetical protein
MFVGISLAIIVTLVECFGKYEDHKVTVVGTYIGPESYTTVHGAARTVPCVSGAKIVQN